MFIAKRSVQSTFAFWQMIGKRITSFLRSGKKYAFEPGSLPRRERSSASVQLDVPMASKSTYSNVKYSGNHKASDTADAIQVVISGILALFDDRKSSFFPKVITSVSAKRLI